MEKYKIPYIPTKEFDPKEFYQLNWSKREALDEALYISVSAGKIEIIKELIGKGAKDFNGSMLKAVEIGNEELVDFFISKGAYKFNEALEYAALSGNLDMVKKFSNAPITNKVMDWAISSKNIEIIKFLIELGYQNLNYILKIASERGMIDIVKLVYEKGARKMNQALIGASVNVIDFLIDHCADDLTTALNVAAWNGNLEVVKLLVSRGANEFDFAIKNAANAGHQDIYEYLTISK